MGYKITGLEKFGENIEKDLSIKGNIILLKNLNRQEINCIGFVHSFDKVLLINEGFHIISFDELEFKLGGKSNYGLWQIVAELDVEISILDVVNRL